MVINKNATETVLELARFQEVQQTPASALDVFADRTVKPGVIVTLPPRSFRIFEVP